MPAPPPRDPSAMWHKRSTGLPSTPSGQTCRPSGILACGFSRGRGQTGLSTATLDLVTFEFALSLSRGQRHPGAENLCGKYYLSFIFTFVSFPAFCQSRPCTPCFFKVHKDNFNEGKRYYCNQCDYNAAHSLNLKFHIQNIHEGIRYECNECDFKTTQRKNLRTHTESKHKGLKYDCSECDFKATHKYGLKRHMQRVHNI